jgi:hypothetical protein
MGPISLTQDASLHDVKAPAATPEAAPGQQHVLGTRVDFSASTSDDTIAYIATATPPTGYVEGDVFTGPGYSDLTNINTLVAAGAIEKFVSPGEAGGQTWIYVQAGEAIARGEAVMLDATQVDPITGSRGKMVALKATDASKVIGVAQWNIPNTNFAWVLCQGVGKVLSGGAIAQGDLLATTTGAAAVAGAGVVTYGHALELTGVAALIDASIHSLG